MRTPTRNTWSIAAALALMLVLDAAHLAHAEPAPRTHATAPKRFVIRESALPSALEVATFQRTQTTRSRTSKECRPVRRAWIGAIIGGAVATPLARFAYQRFENEGANGTRLATVIIGGSAAVGALVGATTCD